MKINLECIFCDGIASLHKKDALFEFRKEKFDVVEHYYVCNKCNTEFSNSAIDTITVLQAHNQYREKNNIPFPEEIKEIKERYGVSASKMSDILGLGANSYSNYESGEVPSAAMGNLIRYAENTEIFFQLLHRCNDKFPAKVVDDITIKINELRSNKSESIDIDLYKNPNKFKGFKRTNLDKIKASISYFILHCPEKFNDRIKLNKLLFFTDFYHYNQYAHSFTGISYRAIKYGPVPSNYDNLFNFLISNGHIEPNWHSDDNKGAKEIFTSIQKPTEDDFTSAEFNTIQTVVNKLGQLPSWDLVDMSHEEEAWIDLNTEKEIIDYQKYAFKLKAIN